MEKSQKNRSDKSRSPWRTFGSVYKREVHLLDGAVTVTVKPYKMFRSIAAVFIVALPLLQAASAIDISQDKNIHVELTSNDAVQQTKSVSDPKASPTLVMFKRIVFSRAFGIFRTNLFVLNACIVFEIIIFRVYKFK